MARDVRISVDEFAIAERIDQINAIIGVGVGRNRAGGCRRPRVRVVDAQVIVLTQWPGAAVCLRPAVCCLRKTGIGGQPLERRSAVIVTDTRIDDHQRTERLPVMRRRSGDESRRIGDGPQVQLHVGPTAAPSVIAVNGPRIAPVDRRDPGHVGRREMTVHVVPPRPRDAPIMRHARMPFVGLMRAQATDVATIRGHVVQRVRRAYAATTQVTAPPLGNKRDPAARQPARIEVVPGPVGQLD